MNRSLLGTDVQRSAALTRRRALMALPVAAAPLAVACGPQAPAAVPATDTRQPAKLLWEIRGGATYEELVKEGLQLFKQRFPNVEVEYFPKAGNWQDKLLSGWAAGSGADVFQAWDDNFWRFAAAGTIVNINDLLKDYKKSDLDDFVKGQWNGFQIPNTNIRFGMPTYINTGVLYFNRNTFRRAGVKEPDTSWTYNDYAEASKRLTRIVDGRQVYGNYHPSTGFNRMQNQLWAFGGHFVDPKDFKKTLVHAPEAQQAFQWLHDRYAKENSWIRNNQRPSGFTFWGALGDGLIAMAEEGMHALKDVARVEGMEFDIAPIPKGPKQRLSWITTDGWGIWNGSKARWAAWELVKFLTSVEWYRLQSRIELLIPSRVSVLDDWIQVLREKFPNLQRVNLKVVRDNLTASPPVVSTWEQFLCATEAKQIIEPTLNELYNEVSANPSVFRDRKDQIEQAAGGCGLTLK
jgi:multiple sugar transport system substrate-binding protein